MNVDGKVIISKLRIVLIFEHENPLTKIVIITIIKSEVSKQLIKNKK